MAGEGAERFRATPLRRPAEERRRGTVDCPRCQGPMVSERYMDLLDDTGVYGITAWRCLCCGDVADPVILANRAHRPEPAGEQNPRKRPRFKVAG